MAYLDVVTGHNLLALLAIPLVPVIVLLATWASTTYSFSHGGSGKTRKGAEPLTVPYWLPWFGSFFRFTNDQAAFWEDISKLTRIDKLLRVRAGPLQTYIITGSHNVQTVFRNYKNLSFDHFQRRVMTHAFGMSTADLNIVLGNPVPGSGFAAEKSPYMTVAHRIYHEHVASTNAVNSLTSKFIEIFSDVIDEEPRNTWQTVSLYGFMRGKMSKPSIVALLGPRILEINPTFIEEFWAFDSVFLRLTYGLPRFAFPKGHEIRDRAVRSTKKWLVDAWARYDWEGPDADVDWEPNFGSRAIRAREALWKKIGLGLDSAASMEFGLVLALNGNALPTAGWTLINIVQRPDLLEQVRDELKQASTLEEKTGKVILNLPVLVTLPLLLAIYTESLRLRVSVNITREVIKPIEVDGYHLKTGHHVFAPTYIAHTKDPVWDTEEYSSQEFRPERFLTHVADEKDGKPKLKFSTEGKSGKLFPYGGGTVMCPGRFFAKQEIMAGVALMVLNFDFEFIEYVKMDGTPSDREPRVNPAYVGSGAAPPDRDMKVRIKKR